MTQLRWTDDCEVGISQVDRDHRYLLQMINRIIVLAESGRMKHMDAWQARLNEYAASHFMREELLMETVIPEWPERAAHIKEHRNYWIWLARLDMNSDPQMMVEFLRSWWMKLILGQDKAMGQALQARGLH